MLTKVCIIKTMFFSSSHVWMWEVDQKKAECQRIDAFELWCWRRLLKVPWTVKRSNQSIIKEINPEYSWKDWCWSWSYSTLATWCEKPTHRKGPDAGKDWRQEEKRTTEDQIIGWHHWLNEHEFEQTLGDGEGQEGLVCCSPWGHKELDMTEWLNNNSNNDKGLSMS